MAKKHRTSAVASDRTAGTAARRQRRSPTDFGTDAAEIRKLVSKFAAPAGYDRFQLEFGEDATGDPAVWVWFIVEDDPMPSKEQVALASALAENVRNVLIDSGHDWWPYVGFRADG